ncbi:orotate phosphoribosyltransferase [Anaerolineales bacterium]
MNTSKEIAQLLLNNHSVGISLDKPITFKSGILSPIYVDNRSIIFHPEYWHQIIQGFVDLIAKNQLDYDVIAGVAVGAVPHSSALAYQVHKPSIFIRKEAKSHGKTQRIEGGDIQGKKVLLIEDLITTGGSSLSAIEEIRSAGGICKDCMAIVSYEMEVAQQNFLAADVRLYTLTNFQTILEIGQGSHFTPVEVRTALEWFDDPMNWKGNISE